MVRAASLVLSALVMAVALVPVAVEVSASLVLVARFLRSALVAARVPTLRQPLALELRPARWLANGWCL